MINLTGKRSAATMITLTLWIGAGCASPPPSGVEGPAPILAKIPRFAADDPRVETAGFVSQTLQIHKDSGEKRFTLMAFVVGDTLTLGAMVRGAYAGEVRWTVGGHSLAFHFDTAGSIREVPIKVDRGNGDALTGRGAEFRGTSWLNAEVPVSWLPPGGLLGLEFRSASGPLLALPKLGSSYRATYFEPESAPTSPRS